MLEKLQGKVADKAMDFFAIWLEGQKDDFKVQFHAWLDKTDLPIPDDIEKPLDELIAIAADLAIDQVVNTVKGIAKT